MTISVPTSNRFEILLLLNIIMLKILIAMLHVAIGNPNLGSRALKRDKRKMTVKRAVILLILPNMNHNSKSFAYFKQLIKAIIFRS